MTSVSDSVSSAVSAPALSLKGKTWYVPPVDARQALQLAQQHGLSPVVAQVLALRGIAADAVAGFLTPKVRDVMPNPLQLKDMDKMVARLAQAVERREKIILFADYDVDGATSASLLHRYLAPLGAVLQVYIPDRLKEGYGPNVAAVQKLIGEGAQLFVFLDCGTTAFTSLAEVRAHNIDSLVIDHHQPDVSLPDHYALVNPHRLDESAEARATCSSLCTAGLVFLCLVALRRQLGEGGRETGSAPDLLSLLDLVALGTVCDMVPLLGLNRAFVAQGLHVMRQSPKIGLKTLLERAGVEEAPSAYHLGFVVGPRLNAGGRVGTSNAAFDLLATDDAGQALELVQMLQQNNQHRQKLESQAVEQALLEVEERHGHDPFLFLRHPDWHSGVVGLIASRVTEKFHRPSLALTRVGEVWKGSGRSIAGFDLGAAIQRARQTGLLLNGGGHAMAVGVSVAEDKLDALRQFLREEIDRIHPAMAFVPEIVLDADVPISAASLDLCAQLEQLAPFGQGFAAPRFLIRNVRPSYVKIMQDKHLAVTLEDAHGKTLKAVCFRCLPSPLGQALSEGKNQRFDVCGSLKIDTWQGRQTVKFFIDDARFSIDFQNRTG